MTDPTPADPDRPGKPSDRFSGPVEDWVIVEQPLPRHVIRRIIEAVNGIGVSHDHIARELTEDAVPNPSGGTSWDASTIRAVLASKAAADAVAPHKAATKTVEHFNDPASAPFGAATAIIVTDPDGGVGISYSNAAGQWVGCAIGQRLPGGDVDTNDEPDVGEPESR